MKITGKLEVFLNEKGYVTGVFKAWDKENKNVLGKAYMDVKLPEGVEVAKGHTLTLDVREAYLNTVYVAGEKPFTKLKINVVDCLVEKEFAKGDK